MNDGPRAPEPPGGPGWLVGITPAMLDRIEAEEGRLRALADEWRRRALAAEAERDALVAGLVHERPDEGADDPAATIWVATVPSRDEPGQYDLMFCETRQRAVAAVRRCFGPDDSEEGRGSRDQG